MKLVGVVLEGEIPSGEIVHRLEIIVIGILVEIAEIRVVFDDRYIRGFDGLGSETLPAEALEPLVLGDVLDAAALIAEPIDGVLATQPLDEHGRDFGNLAREVDGLDALQYDIVGVHGVCTHEWRVAGEQLEYEHA